MLDHSYKFIWFKVPLKPKGTLWKCWKFSKGVHRSLDSMQLWDAPAVLSIIRAIKPPVTKDMQYTGAGESMHCFKLHKQNFLSLSPPPFYTELTFLIQLTSSFLSWRNQRTAPPWVSSTGIFRKATCESEKPVSVLPAPFCTTTPSHTHRYFQSSITTSIIWGSAFELSHPIRLDNRSGENDCPKRQE